MAITERLNIDPRTVRKIKVGILGGAMTGMAAFGIGCGDKGTTTTSETGVNTTAITATTPSSLSPATTENQIFRGQWDYVMKDGETVNNVPAMSLVVGDGIFNGDIRNNDDNARTGHITLVEDGSAQSLTAPKGLDIHLHLPEGTQVFKQTLEDAIILMKQKGKEKGQGVDKVIITEFVGGQLKDFDFAQFNVQDLQALAGGTVVEQTPTGTTTTTEAATQSAEIDHVLKEKEVFDVPANSIVQGDIRMLGRTGPTLYDVGPGSQDTALITLFTRGGKIFAEWGGDVQTFGTNQALRNTVLEKDIQETLATGNFKKVIVKMAYPDGSSEVLKTVSK